MRVFVQPVQVSVYTLSWTRSIYPYKGYVAMELKFLDDGAHAEPKMVLALVCPDPNGPDQAPVIIGTNARNFRHEPKTRDNTECSGQVNSWRVCTQTPVQVEQKPSLCPIDDSVGHIRWTGPGPLTIPPGGMVFAACKVTAKEPWEQDVLVVEALAQHPLPAGVVVTPCVLLPSDMNVDSFSVLVRNESLKARSIPLDDYFTE